MNKEEKMILVPLGSFVDGVTAQADLDSIRALIKHGGGYCSYSMMAVLGIPVLENQNTTSSEMIGGEDAGTD